MSQGGEGGIRINVDGGQVRILAETWKERGKRPVSRSRGGALVNGKNRGGGNFRGRGGPSVGAGGPGASEDGLGSGFDGWPQSLSAFSHSVFSSIFFIFPVRSSDWLDDIMIPSSFVIAYTFFYNLMLWCTYRMQSTTSMNLFKAGDGYMFTFVFERKHLGILCRHTDCEWKTDREGTDQSIAARNDGNIKGSLMGEVACTL